MHIVIDGRTIQDRFPGIGRYGYNLVRALGSLDGDDRITVLCSPSLPNSRYDLTVMAASSRVDLLPVDVPTFSLLEQTYLPVLLRRIGADLLHSAHYIMPYRAPCRTVVSFHDTIGRILPSALPSASARLLYRFTTWLAVRTSACVLAPSESTRRDILRLYRVAPERVVAVPYAVDASFAPQSAATVRSTLGGLGLPARYVLYLGINKPHKNLPRLVEAWHKVDPQLREGASLVLAGREDPRYPEARDRAAELALGDTVRFLGNVPEAILPALYSGATLFAFPSLYEGFGFPVLEAMACGAPVVCSDASSLPEVVGDAGVLLPPTDVPAWSAAIAELLGDRARLDDMRSRSLQQAARFSWERTARETLQVYHAVGARS